MTQFIQIINSIINLENVACFYYSSGEKILRFFYNFSDSNFCSNDVTIPMPKEDYEAFLEQLVRWGIDIPKVKTAEELKRYDAEQAELKKQDDIAF